MSLFGKSKTADLKIPTRESIRRALIAVLRSDADLNAFCLDYFTEVYNEFTGSMTRTDKMNLLFHSISTVQILSRLQEVYPEEMDLHKHCITMGNGADILSASSFNTHQQRNRRRMIEKVKKFWIEDVLEKSLHNTVMIELGKEYRPDAVEYPWSIVMQRSNNEPEIIPKHKKMIELFDENLEEMLILGAPGSGKTTMLLELCRDLLQRAEDDEIEPIPVVLNLSTWAQKHYSIEEWIVDELNLRYDIPRKIGNQWNKSSQILPLLDGLDEVKTEYRDACIAALNQWHQNYGTKVAICSRLADYQSLSRRIKLRCAIMLQPLTLQKIHETLENIGDASGNLSSWIDSDSHMRELLSVPLFLDIIMQINKFIDLHSLSNDLTIDQYRYYVLDFYSNYMMHRRGVNLLYDQSSTLKYLSTIARNMQIESRHIFYMEDLQPSMIGSRVLFFLYKVSSVFMLYLICFIANSVSAIPLWNRAIANGSKTHWLNWWVALALSVPMALFVGFLSGFGKFEPIKPIDSLGWSWEHLINGPLVKEFRKKFLFLLRRSFYIGLFSIPFLEYWLFALQKNTESKSIENPILMAIIYAIIILPFSIIFYFLNVLSATPFIIVKYGTIEDKVPIRMRPNQGMKKCIRTAGTLLIISMLLSLWELMLPTQVFMDSTIWPLAVNMFLLNMPWLLIPSLGGSAVSYHYTLRFVLWINRQLPFKLVNFLDFCADRVFLRKIGGGYIFTHRILMEYFASLTEKDIERLSAKVEARHGHGSSIATY